MIHRGGIYWADLGEASGSKPAKRRPVLVIQSRPFNASRLGTTVAAVITSNTRLATMPGNVFIPGAATGLPQDSVVNVTALVTLDKTDLGAQAGHLPDSLMDDVDRGLRRLLSPVTRQEDKFPALRRDRGPLDVRRADHRDRHPLLPPRPRPPAAECQEDDRADSPVNHGEQLFGHDEGETLHGLGEN